MPRGTKRDAGCARRDGTLPFPTRLARVLRRIVGPPDFGRFDAKLEQRIAEVKAALGVLERCVEARMAAFEARIIKWMFLFWVGQAVTTVGLVFGVVRLTGR